VWMASNRLFAWANDLWTFDSCMVSPQICVNSCWYRNLESINSFLHVLQLLKATLAWTASCSWSFVLWAKDLLHCVHLRGRACSLLLGVCSAFTFENFPGPPFLRRNAWRALNAAWVLNKKKKYNNSSVFKKTFCIVVIFNQIWEYCKMTTDLLFKEKKGIFGFC